MQRMVDRSIYLICYYAIEMSKYDKDVHGARRLKLPYPIPTPNEPSALRISLQVAVMKLSHMLPHLNTLESMIASSLVVSMLACAEKKTKYTY